MVDNLPVDCTCTENVSLSARYHGYFKKIGPVVKLNLMLDNRTSPMPSHDIHINFSKKNHENRFRIGHDMHKNK